MGKKGHLKPSPSATGAFVTTDYLMAVVEKLAIDPETVAERTNFRLKLHQYFKRLGTLIELTDISAFVSNM
tara:strand:+ start:266 stop:478 length:213 start_codon:yes stop_codon:yes gene_type:complete